MTESTPPDPPAETTLHPDDGASLSTVEIFLGTPTDASTPLYRVDKDLPDGDGGVRTQYSFRRTLEDTEQVLLEVAHGEASNGGSKPPASIADLTVSRKVGGKLRSLRGPRVKQFTKADLPQTWYTYEDTDSGDAFTVVIYRSR